MSMGLSRFLKNQSRLNRGVLASYPRRAASRAARSSCGAASAGAPGGVGAGCRSLSEYVRGYDTERTLLGRDLLGNHGGVKRRIQLEIVHVSDLADQRVNLRKAAAETRVTRTIICYICR